VFYLLTKYFVVCLSYNRCHLWWCLFANECGQHFQTYENVYTPCNSRKQTNS